MTPKIGTNESRAHRLTLYAMAAGGAMVSTVAGAAPTPINPLLVGFDENITDDSVEFDLDINGDGTDNFRLRLVDSPSSQRVELDGLGTSPPPNRVLNSDLDCNSTGAYYAGNLAAGTAVGPASGNDVNSGAGFNNYSFIYRDRESADPSLCSEFTPGQPGFVGLKFDVNGDTHYGFLQVQVDVGSVRLQILGGAYESDPDTAIVVELDEEEGEAPDRPAPIPVPVGGAIPIGLGLLALGAVALRRRKNLRDH